MAAAVNPLPQKRKRGIGDGQPNLFPISEWTGKPAEFNEYGRDPFSPAELQRKRTTWHECKPEHWEGKEKSDFSGYAAKPHSFFADVPRLSRSVAQYVLLDYGWDMSYGRERKKGEVPPVW